MSLDTSPYRYEVMTDRKSLQNALMRQEERIMRDEMMDARENKVLDEADINLKSEWKESLADSAQRRAFGLNRKQVDNEIQLAHKAAIMVRRAALRQLLELDSQILENELQALGKAFYMKRT